MDFLTRTYEIGPLQVVPAHVVYLLGLFLLFIWVMKRFLFAPLVRIMDSREARVREAELAEREAREQVEEGMRRYREALLAARKEAFGVREASMQEAESQRLERLRGAKEEAAAMVAEAQERLRFQLKEGERSVEKEARKLARAIALRVLGREGEAA